MQRAFDILRAYGVCAAAEPQAHVSVPEIMLVTQMFTNARGVTEKRVAAVLAAFQKCLAHNGVRADARCEAEMLDDELDAAQYVLYAGEIKFPVSLHDTKAVAAVLTKLHRAITKDPVLLKAGCAEHSHDTAAFVRTYLAEMRYTSPGSVMAAAEPQVPEPPGEQQWRRFCAVMAHKFPDRFKLQKSPEGSVAITDVRKCVDVNRRADGVALYANGRAVIGGLSLALQYTDHRIVEAASAFVRIQDAADRLYQAATDAMAGPMQEIQALLPEVKRKGNVVQRAVDTFRARVSKGFRESGAHFREPVL